MAASYLNQPQLQSVKIPGIYKGAEPPCSYAASSIAFFMPLRVSLPEVNLTKAERLILVNQYRILEKLHPEEAKYYAHAAEIFSSGYTRLYGELTEHIQEEIPPDISTEVTDILDMYRALHHASKESFPGFDGNEETEQYGYARFMIEEMGQWEELKGNDLNSHTPMLPQYRAMLSEWKASPKKYALTDEDATRISKGGDM